MAPGLDELSAEEMGGKAPQPTHRDNAAMNGAQIYLFLRWKDGWWNQRPPASWVTGESYTGESYKGKSYKGEGYENGSIMSSSM